MKITDPVLLNLFMREVAPTLLWLHGDIKDFTGVGRPLVPICAPE